MNNPGRDTSPAPSRLSHEAAESLISARLDAPLDAASNRALLAHLATCPSCRAFADHMSVMARGLRDIPQLPPSPAVSRQVRERLQAGQPWWSRFTTGAGSGFGAMQAAAAMLILVGAVAVVLLVQMTRGNDNGGFNPPDVSQTETAQVALSQTQAASPTATNTPGDAVKLTPRPTRTPRPDPTATLPNVQITLAPPTATASPTATSTNEPAPTETETTEPTATPTDEPTKTPRPTRTPTEEPTATPTEEPTETPTEEPTLTPTDEPTESATAEPTNTQEPTETATEEPTSTPTETPTARPTRTPKPTRTPTATPEPTETREPTTTPTVPIVASDRTPPGDGGGTGGQSEEQPTEQATDEPTAEPATEEPTEAPTEESNGQTIVPRGTQIPEASGNGSGGEENGNQTGNQSGNGNATGSGGGNSTGGDNGTGETNSANESNGTGSSGIEPSGNGNNASGGDGQTVEASPSEGAVAPYANAEELGPFPAGVGATTGLRLSPMGDQFAFTDGRTITLVTTEGAPVDSFSGSAFMWSPQGGVLLYQDDGAVFIWDRDTGQTSSVTAQTQGDGGNVVDYAAGWSDAQLLYLRTYSDDPGRTELHVANWDGSNDSIASEGSLGAIQVQPVATTAGVWVVTDDGWVQFTLDGGVSDPRSNPWGAISTPITSPYGSVIAFVTGDGQLIVVTADNPDVPFAAPIPDGGAGFAFSPDGSMLVVANGNGLTTYQMESGAQLGHIEGAPVAAPGWSGSGIYAVTQSEPATLIRLPESALNT